LGGARARDSAVALAVAPVAVPPSSHSASARLPPTLGHRSHHLTLRRPYRFTWPSILRARCPVLVARLVDPVGCLLALVGNSTRTSNPELNLHLARILSTLSSSPARTFTGALSFHLQYSIFRDLSLLLLLLFTTRPSTRSRPPPETGISTLVGLCAQSTPDDLRTHASLGQLHSPLLSNRGKWESAPLLDVAGVTGVSDRGLGQCAVYVCFDGVEYQAIGLRHQSSPIC
jgi:hypothetical protein